MPRSRVFAAGVLIACALAPGRSQSRLADVEQKMAAFADKSRPEAEALLERVVNINSGTMNLAGVKRIGEVFDAELKAVGFKTRWVEGASFKRAGHLVAERSGKGSHLLL